MTGLTVVLGWDGLDYDLVERFGLDGAFGTHSTRLETFDNPDLGTPHTYEVWPSIITGASPDDHGLRLSGTGGVAWRNPLASAISTAAQGVVPRSLRATIGEQLHNRGAAYDFKRDSYYAKRGLSTVFDGRASRAVAVPNYRVAADDDLDLAFDRGAQLTDFLATTTVDGVTEHRPTVPLARLEERLAGEASMKVGVVRAALRREYDLVFCWLGILDTVGHLAPAVADTAPDWQEWAYRTAAAWTESVRQDLHPEDTLVCLSDHGLRNGHHTHDAFVGTDDERVLEGVETVFDVRDALDGVTPTGEETESPPLRNTASPEQEGARASDVEATKQQLQSLGYL